GISPCPAPALAHPCVASRAAPPRAGRPLTERRSLMKMQVLPFVAVGLLACGAAVSPAQEKVPVEKVTKPPEVLAAPGSPACEAPCPAPQVLIIERQLPVQVLVAREGVAK